MSVGHHRVALKRTDRQTDRQTDGILYSVLDTTRVPLVEYPPHRTIIPYHQHTIPHAVIISYNISTKPYHLLPCQHTISHAVPQHTPCTVPRIIPYPYCTSTARGAQPYEDTRRACPAQRAAPEKPGVEAGDACVRVSYLYTYVVRAIWASTVKDRLM